MINLNILSFTLTSLSPSIKNVAPLILSKAKKTPFYSTLERREGRVLSQNTLVKPLPSPALLTLNMPNMDNLFPGFTLGDFALLHGSFDVQSLALLLCVRVQLPSQLGGLGSDVVFVDGGNTFRLYRVSHIAQLHLLDPTQVLNRIFISRAFTAHQMTQIILNKLEETTAKHHAKLAIISDIANLYLDKDISTEESKQVYSQVTTHLSKLSQENNLAIIATYPPHFHTRRNAYLHAVTCARANVAISITEPKHSTSRQFVLEKHPTLKLGHADFLPENQTLDDFTGEA